MLNLLETLLTFSLWFSISIRTPNQDVNTLDHELCLGLKTNKMFSEYMIERENGEKYYGRENWFIKDIKDFGNIGRIELGFKDFVRTARDINVQEVSKIFKTDWKSLTFGSGYSYLWQDNFHIPHSCMISTLEFNGLITTKISHTTDFSGYRVVDMYIGKNIVIWKGFVDLETYLKYRTEENEWFQFKTNFKININRLWK